MAGEQNNIMNASESIPLLREYCQFGEDRVYLFMAIARQKENQQLTSNDEIVFREIVKDEHDIQKKYQRLQSAAESRQTTSDKNVTFRLYMTVNPRNTLDAYFMFRQRSSLRGFRRTSR